MLDRRFARTTVFSPNHRGVGGAALGRKSISDTLGIGAEYEGQDKSKRAISIALGIATFAGMIGVGRTMWVNPNDTKSLVLWGGVAGASVFAQTLVY